MKKEITLSSDQSQALERILKWWKIVQHKKDFYESPDQVLTLGGYAGTGKSTILSFLREELGKDISVGFVSLTGKAVSVMNTKLWDTGAAMGNDVISTLHSYMYTPITDSRGRIIDWVKKNMDRKGGSTRFSERVHSAPYVDLFINDEASMTSKELYDDLLSYGKPVLAIGDHGQLPPVQGYFNLMKDPTIRLEKIHRQAEDSPILHLATLAREGNFIPYSEFSSQVKKFTTEEAMEDERINQILSSPSPDNIILTATNRARVSFNKTTRQQLHLTSDKPEKRDKVICLRNNHKEGVYNGMLGEILSIKRDTEHPEQNYFATIKEYGGEILHLPITKHTFNQLKKEEIRKDWKKLGTQWDYGYCITCHKAQGSEFQTVIVYGEAWPEIRNRWLYTAITRAQEELYLIN